MLLDSHSHIQFVNEFPDVEAVIKRAEQNDVNMQILVSCNPKDSFTLPVFLKKYSGKNFWGTVGVHPHDANRLSDNVLKDFKDLIGREKKIIGIGEVGLDYFRNIQPGDIQKKAFIDQLNLAKELDLPVVIHVRDAYEDAFKILEEMKMKKVILHTFGGNMDLARRSWDNGYYTSFSGVITYPKNEYLRDIVAEAPEELILIETDCPYLPPQKYRGQRNEPAYVAEVAREIAMVRRMDFELVAEITTNNAIKAFNLPI
jgi:TatD DNase family protein